MGKSDRLRNWEIATYALYLLKGTQSRIATEDVALKCYELAPESFSWVRYPQYPDKDIVRSALMDARKEVHGGLVMGRAGRGKGRVNSENVTGQTDGWMLTRSGVNWIAMQKRRMYSELGEREATTYRQERLQKVAQWKKHTLYREFAAERGVFNPSLSRLAEFFRCRVDADRAIWDKRVAEAMNVAQSVDDHLLIEFFEKCGRTLAESFARA